MFHTRHLPLTPACLTSFARFKRPCRRNATYLMPTLRSSSHESLPRIAQPSFWQSMIPKFLRGSDLPATPAKLQRFKEWNPATFFIIIFLLIGSNAIQMIALQNDFKNFSRKADAKIGLLQDAIERLKRGEVADIEKLLGSGDEQNERDWEDVLREIEDEDRLWQKKRDRRTQPRKGNDKDTQENKFDGTDDSGSNTETVDGEFVTARKKIKRSATPGFY